MNLFEAFDVQVSQDAKTFPLSETASIDLLPLASDVAKRKFDQLMEPYQARLNAGIKLTEDENKKLNIKFFAETIVRGWKGLTDAEGKDVKYTTENAAKLFEALPRFFALVLKLSSDEDAFTITKTADDEKNS
jgi:hypothetical protein